MPGQYSNHLATSPVVILFFLNTKGMIYKISKKQGFIKSKKNFSFEQLSTMREQTRE